MKFQAVAYVYGVCWCRFSLRGDRRHGELPRQRPGWTIEPPLRTEREHACGGSADILFALRVRKGVHRCVVRMLMYFLNRFAWKRR